MYGDMNYISRAEKWIIFKSNLDILYCWQKFNGKEGVGFFDYLQPVNHMLFKGLLCYPFIGNRFSFQYVLAQNLFSWVVFIVPNGSFYKLFMGVKVS